MSINLKNISKEDLIHLYGDLIKELKTRGIIRTGNIIGDLGESIAIEYYCNNPALPKLTKASIGTQNIDAIDRKGQRYSIKSTTTTTTGVFHGLNYKGVEEKDKQVFEYVIICKFNKNIELESIYQLNWEKFLENKKWHARMKAWNLIISKKLISDSEIIFQKEEKNSI